MPEPRPPEPGADRAVRAAVAGHRRLGTAASAEWEEAVASDDDPRVRAAALAALVRGAPRRVAGRAWRVAARDPDASVRRRAAECAPALGAHVAPGHLLRMLTDADAWVAEAAAFALGERTDAHRRAVPALAAIVRGHGDALVREAAVAALGALGDPAGLPAVLAACDDKPAVRRRAVLALAAFEGPDVEARLTAALEDRDWQVRAAAETVLSAGCAP